MTPTLWTQVASDTRFCLEEPTPDMVKLDDIFYSLAGQNRYNGHTRPRITVAEHSIRVAVLAAHLTIGNEAEAGAHGLVHDFHEAYAGDIISPVIRLLSRESDAYKKLIAKIDEAIFTKIGHEPVSMDIAAVRQADLLALELERTACMGPSPAPPGDGWPVHDERIVKAAREAWKKACATGLDDYGCPFRWVSEFGWSPERAELLLTNAFDRFFPGTR